MAEKEYIEREAAIKTAEFYWCDPDAVPHIIESLKLKPAADVRPVVRGKWIWKESGEVVCSKCNDLMAIVGNTEDFITVKSYHNFCPNCGADMREANDGT